MATITSANAILLIGIEGVFVTPQSIHGFATDDITDFDALQVAEVMMGVDGILSGGYVFQPVHQKIQLQADSSSSYVFEEWKRAQDQNGDLYFGFGSISFKGINRRYTMRRGILSTMSIMPNAKKTLQARTYEIVWERVQAAPIDGS